MAEEIKASAANAGNVDTAMPTEEPALGRFGSDANALYASYQELEGKLGADSEEKNSMRAQNELLMQQNAGLQQSLINGQQQAAPAPASAPGIDEQLAVIEDQVANEELTFQDAQPMRERLILQKGAEMAQENLVAELDRRQEAQDMEAYLDATPGLREMMNTPQGQYALNQEMRSVPGGESGGIGAAFGRIQLRVMEAEFKTRTENLVALAATKAAEETLAHVDAENRGPGSITSSTGTSLTTEPNKGPLSQRDVRAMMAEAHDKAAG